MSEEKRPRIENPIEKAEEIPPVEMYVGHELGTTGSVSVTDETDSMQYSLLNEAEILALSYFEQIDNQSGGEYARRFCELYRRHKMSLHGWRANQLIRLVSGSKGVSPDNLVRRPGFIGRHVTNRDWKEKAERGGAQVIE